jgi:hypothetical protein
MGILPGDDAADDAANQEHVTAASTTAVTVQTAVAEIVKM